MSKLNEHFQRQLATQSEVSGWYVAYSGGLDSTVLLHLLAQAYPASSIVAVHVNHQLSDDANGWAQHCAEFCESLGVAFQSHRVDVIASGFGVEDAARKARYRVFESVLAKNGVLLMGHHLDDQAETFLLRLMRGSGVRGLSAMAAERSLVQGKLLRPLLDCSRQQLQAYAKNHRLTWVEDDSNQCDSFDRNFLRLEVVPKLQQRWQGFAKRWQQSAQLMRETDELMSDVATEDLSRLGARTEKVGSSVDLTELSAMSKARRNNALRYWAEGLSIAMPDQKQLREIDSQLLNARADAKGEVKWNGWVAAVHRGRLHLWPEFKTTPPRVFWDGMTPLKWGDWLLTLEPSDHGFLIPEGGFDVDLRAVGDRCQPEGRRHSQTLKKLFNEYHLPPWLRGQIPLLRSAKGIVAVGDLWCCEPFISSLKTTQEPSYRLVWAYCLH